MPSEALAEEGTMGPLAQSAERPALNRQVRGSWPRWSSNSSAYPNRQRDRVESALSGRSSRPADTTSQQADRLGIRAVS